MISRSRRRIGWLLVLGVALGTAAGVLFTWVLPSLPMVDLSVYRSGGQKLLQGIPLYDGKVEGVTLPFTYPPFAAVLFIPFALLSAWAGSLVITALSALALGRASWLLVGARWPHLSTPVRWQSTIALWSAAMWAEPTTATIGFGQINLLILWLVLEDLIGPPRRGKGLLIGIATGLKLTPGFFVLMLAVCGRRVAAFRAGCAVLATIAIGLVAAPSQGWLYWTKLAYDDRRVGGVAYVANQSLNGVIWRLSQPGGVRLLWLLLAFLVAVSAMWAARTFWQTDQPLLAIAVSSLGMLLVSPISWSHHWVWVVPIGVALTAVQPRRLAGALLVSGLVVFYSRGIFDVPNTNDREYFHSLVQQIVGNSYALWAVAALVSFVVVAARASRSNRDGVEVSLAVR